MRCPACGYLSFETGASCRNCGQDLAAAAAPPDGPEVEVRVGQETDGPLDDLALRPPPPTPDLTKLDRALRQQPEAELPLFGGPPGRDAGAGPLVTPPARPRAPLAVRRPTPDALRSRGPAAARARQHQETPEPAPLDLTAPLARPAGSLFPGPRHARAVPSSSRDKRGERRGEGEDAPAAPAPARLAAAAIDLAILGTVDAAVVYFTLRIVALGFDDIGLLPPLPLGGFLLLLNGGYLAAFTAAGGQTIGKMAARIRVLTVDGRRVRFVRALGRTGALMMTCLTAGAGFLPALAPGTGRTLHDRLAHTRVVRA